MRSEGAPGQAAGAPVRLARKRRILARDFPGTDLVPQARKGQEADLCGFVLLPQAVGGDR